MQPTWRSSRNPGFLTHCIERVTAGEKEEIKQAQWLIGKDKKKHHHIKEINQLFGNRILTAELKNETPLGIINNSYPFN